MHAYAMCTCVTSVQVFYNDTFDHLIVVHNIIILLISFTYVMLNF